jgi:LmbE family N-acetylglucosaminyl deacetylase
LVGLVAAIAFLAALAYSAVDWFRPPGLGDPARAVALGRELTALPRRVLVVAAHPDDVEWYAGGLLALLAAGGSSIEVLMATDGELGIGGGRQLGLRRRAEQLEAARRIGYAGVTFLGLGDSRLVWRKPSLRSAVSAAHQRARPEVLMTFDAENPKLPYLHPDHQAAGRVVVDFWRSLAGERPALCLFSSARPNLIVDTSPVMELKIDALGAHRTQGFRPRGRSFVVTMGRATGRAMGAPFAEVFRWVPGLAGEAARDAVAAGGLAAAEGAAEAAAGGAAEAADDAAVITGGEGPLT